MFNLHVDIVLHVLQFMKGNGKYIEEKKLRVILISAVPDVTPTKEDSEKEPAEKTRTLGVQASNGLDKPLPEQVRSIFLSLINRIILQKHKLCQ